MRYEGSLRGAIRRLSQHTVTLVMMDCWVGSWRRFLFYIFWVEFSLVVMKNWRGKDNLWMIFNVWRFWLDNCLFHNTHSLSYKRAPLISCGIKFVRFFGRLFNFNWCIYSHLFKRAGARAYFQIWCWWSWLLNIPKATPILSSHNTLDDFAHLIDDFLHDPHLLLYIRHSLSIPLHASLIRRHSHIKLFNSRNCSQK